jgi:hypothetical protein
VLAAFPQTVWKLTRRKPASSAQRQKVYCGGGRFPNRDVGNSNLAQGAQETFLAIAYTGQDVVRKITRAGWGLAGKATNVVHFLCLSIPSPEQFRCRSWKASRAFWLHNPIMERFTRRVNRGSAVCFRPGVRRKPASATIGMAAYVRRSRRWWSLEAMMVAPIDSRIPNGGIAAHLVRKRGDVDIRIEDGAKKFVAVNGIHGLRAGRRVP